MISIQELGLSIMGDTPKPFYIVGGSEYGIKDKYISQLTEFYGNVEEHSSVSDLISFLSVKHIIPIKPALYIVRYDDKFVSSISAAVVQKINSLKFKGSIFCIYDDPKHITKLDKFLPDCTCSIDSVNPKYISKYLHSDFPKLDDRSIEIATKYATSYGHARTLCKSMIHADPASLAKMSEGNVARLFGCGTASEESDIQKAILSRNFNQASKLIDAFEGNVDNIVYSILQSMIEMEKVLTSKYPSSDFKDYAKFWKLQDVYHMFMNTYNELEKLRSNTSTDVRSSLVYLLGLMTFKDIPSLEVMQS